MVQERMQSAEVTSGDDLGLNPKILGIHQPSGIAVCARVTGLDGPSMIRVDHLAVLVLPEIDAPVR